MARFNDPVSGPATRELVGRIDALYATLDFTPVFSPDAFGPDAADAMVAASTHHPFRINNRRDSSDEQLFALLADAGATRKGNQ